MADQLNEEVCELIQALQQKVKQQRDSVVFDGIDAREMFNDKTKTFFYEKVKSRKQLYLASCDLLQEKYFYKVQEPRNEYEKRAITFRMKEKKWFNEKMFMKVFYEGSTLRVVIHPQGWETDYKKKEKHKRH